MAKRPYDRITYWRERQRDQTVMHAIEYRIEIDESELRLMAIRASQNTTHKCVRGPLTVYGEEVQS